RTLRPGTPRWPAARRQALPGAGGRPAPGAPRPARRSCAGTVSSRRPRAGWPGPALPGWLLVPAPRPRALLGPAPPPRHAPPTPAPAPRLAAPAPPPPPTGAKTGPRAAATSTRAGPVSFATGRTSMITVAPQRGCRRNRLSRQAGAFQDAGNPVFETG